MRKVTKEELTRQLMDAVKSNDIESAKLFTEMIEQCKNGFVEVPF